MHPITIATWVDLTDPQQRQVGWGHQGGWWGCGRTGLRPPSGAVPPLGTAPLTLLRRCAPACPHLSVLAPRPALWPFEPPPAPALSCLTPPELRASAPSTPVPTPGSWLEVPTELSSLPPASRDPNIRHSDPSTWMPRRGEPPAHPSSSGPPLFIPLACAHFTPPPLLCPHLGS